MPFEIAEVLRTMSPEYQRTYTEGFEAGKRFALKELKKAEREIQDAEAFSTSTSTSTVTTEELLELEKGV